MCNYAISIKNYENLNNFFKIILIYIHIDNMPKYINIYSQSSLKKAEYKLLRKFIDTLPLYSVFNKILCDICKDNIHPQIIDNL